MRTCRVPIRRQLSELDCGAACLSSILAYHGYENTTSQIADLLDAGRSGVTAASIKDVASQLGMKVRGFKLNEPEDARYIPAPCILHWRFSHFVVLEKVARYRLRLMDPSTGRIWVTLDQAGREFTGVALTFSPTMDFARRRDERPSLWRSYVRNAIRLPKNAWLFAQVVAVTLLIQVFGLLFPLLTKIVVDDVIPGNRVDMMVVLACAFGLIAAGSTVITVLRQYGLAQIRANIDAEMTTEFVKHLLALPFSFFAKRPAGDLIARVASNAEIRQILTNRVFSVVLDSGFATIYLLVILVVSWKFGVLVLLLAILEVATLVLTASRLRELMRRNTGNVAREQAYLVDVLQNISTIKSNGSEDEAGVRWRGLFVRHLETSLAIGRFAGLLDGCLAGLHQIGPLAALWLGAYLVLGGGISLGTMFLLISLSTSFLIPLNGLVSSGQQVYVAYALLERLADVMEASPEHGIVASPMVPTTDGMAGPWDIWVHGVSFRYSRFERLVLSNITLVIKEGTTTAIVGRSGSGKSTLVGVLTGLYEPTEGIISFGNANSKNVDWSALRRRLGVVVQDEPLFGGTLRSNLDLFKPDADLRALERACRIACISELVDGLPMGFESLIAPGGSALSGGERQRIALARALVREPRVLVLDEATSHLDTATETVIRRNLDDLGCTQIVVAHRLSTIRNADQIVVLEDGRIVEKGTHDVLVSNGGVYAKLCEEQGLR